MKQNNSKIQANPGGRTLGTASLLACAAMAAHAADPATGANGLMSFPNVRVVAAPPSAVKPRAAPARASGGGLKAYIDPATGELVQPTPENAAALDTAIQHETPLAATTTQELPQPAEFPGAHGGVGMALDEAHMSFSVARRTAASKLDMDCVHGKQAATAFLTEGGAAHADSKAKGNHR
jgi:hypothetical protein